MPGLIKGISSSVEHFIQDCKELKNYSHMEYGEFERRVTSIILRTTAAAIIAYGASYFVRFSAEYFKNPGLVICDNLQNMNADAMICTRVCALDSLSSECIKRAESIANQYFDDGIKRLSKRILTHINIVLATGIPTFIAAYIPSKLSSMIAPKLQKNATNRNI